MSFFGWWWHACVCVSNVSCTTTTLSSSCCCCKKETQHRGTLAQFQLHHIHDSLCWCKTIEQGSERTHTTPQQQHTHTQQLKRWIDEGLGTKTHPTYIPAHTDPAHSTQAPAGRRRTEQLWTGGSILGNTRTLELNADGIHMPNHGAWLLDASPYCKKHQHLQGVRVG